MSSVNDDHFDISEPLTDICERLGLVPKYVAEMTITPKQVVATIFRGRDGRCQGSKYIGDDGKPAMETLTFAVRT